MDFLLASGNAHKAEEFASLFDPCVIKVCAAPEKIEVSETGSSYHENALQKAEGYYERYKVPMISDDSGINVEELPSELGILSARFGGEGLSDRERAELLLKKMEGVVNRKAYFSCVLCFYLNPDEVFFFEGRLEGQIAMKLKGDKGFGYDPVFIPENAPNASSLAMIPDWKEVHSHRSVASKLAQKFFKERSS